MDILIEAELKTLRTDIPFSLAVRRWDSESWRVGVGQLCGPEQSYSQIGFAIRPTLEGAIRAAFHSARSHANGAYASDVEGVSE